MTAKAKELFDVSVDQVRRGQVRAALGTLMDTLAEDPLHVGALDAAGRICRILGSSTDAERFEALVEHGTDPQHLFEMGFHLVDQGRPDVGKGFLLQALQAADQSGAEAAGGPPVGWIRELALAQLLTRDFKPCLTTLAPLFERPDLAETERLDAELLAAEAALYAGRASLCRSHLETADTIVADDDQRTRLDALHALLGRAARWESSLTRLGLREWHHVQHASVLLKTAGGWFEDGSLGGRFELLELRADMVAFLLQRLLHLLEDRDLLPSAVVAAGSLSEPLAHALAQVTGARLLASLDERTGGRTLLIASSAGELVPNLQDLVLQLPGLCVASLWLDWSQDAPACPEVVGVLARRAFLPWEPRWSVDAQGGQGAEVFIDDQDPAARGAELARAMAALPDDGGAAREQFLEFYRPLHDELVLANPAVHPVRRQFTRLSPAWIPTGSRPEPSSAEQG